MILKKLHFFKNGNGHGHGNGNGIHLGRKSFKHLILNIFLKNQKNTRQER
jgi:hypothetical protein